jgi:hypothetical protein
MLTLACQALDRAEELAAAIKRDGVVIRCKRVVKDHPGLKHEIAAAALWFARCSGLGWTWKR